MALAMDVLDGEFKGEVGFPSLREVAAHCLKGLPVSEEAIKDCQGRLNPWVQEQEQLQEEAFSVIEELEEIMPTTDPINMPGWPWTTWGKTLHLPWSENLSDAVTEAKVMLAAERLG